MKKKLLFLAVLIMWSSVLFGFSGQSGEDSGDLSRRLSEWVVGHFTFIEMDAVTLEPILRKLAHMCIFALEGFLMYCTISLFRMGKRGNWLIAIVICAALGAANELHQLYSAERSCKFTDVLIDTGGAVLGIAFAAFAGWIVHMLDRRLRV